MTVLSMTISIVFGMKKEDSTPQPKESMTKPIDLSTVFCLFINILLCTVYSQSKKM